jgi:hypothetical protein
VSVVGKLVTARMPQHVRIQTKREPSWSPARSNGRAKLAVASGTALRHEQIFGVVCFSLESPQRARLVVLERRDARHAVLESPHVQACTYQIHLTPGQAGSAFAAMVSHQDRRRVPVGHCLIYGGRDHQGERHRAAELMSLSAPRLLGVPEPK